jgi:hypothetical protein
MPTLITFSIILELSNQLFDRPRGKSAYLPMKTFTITLLAEIVTEWIGT